MPAFNDVLAGSLAQAVQVQQIIDALKGTPSKGVPIAITAVNDSANYALTVQNDEATNSRALSVLKADGTSLITADASGVSLGAPLNLPVGSVTSAMIADGTISSVDLGPNVATFGQVQGLSTANPATTSAAFTDIPTLVFTFTPVIPCTVLALLCGSVQYNTLGSVPTLALSLDGAAEVAQQSGQPYQAAGLAQITTVWVFSGVSAASHTLKGRWAISSGQMNMYGQEAVLAMVELLR